MLPRATPPARSLRSCASGAKRKRRPTCDRPHTVELYDFGVTDDQTLYFVMELLDGMDLESLVRDTVRRPCLTDG